MADTLPADHPKLDGDLKFRGRCPASPPMSPPLSPESRANKLLDVDDDVSLDKVDVRAADNYVQKTLDAQKALPPVNWSTLLENLQWVSFLALTVTPALGIYGFATHTLQLKTFLWAVTYYFMTGMSITAVLLAVFGCGAVQGSIKWWSRGHRAHHRYTDTDLDPYNAHKGFFYSHIGWMLLKPRIKPGTADISDLSRSAVVRWQQRWYLYLIVAFGFLFPMAVAGLGWGDWKGGFLFAGAARLCFVHHSTFCVNSLAHWIGEQPFDDKHTPRDHFVTALVTNGEGYHNFHHQFPMDYRNAIKWWQYDPTKCFIWAMSKLGLASQLKTFPQNEIKKGQYTMRLKKFEEETHDIKWAVEKQRMPVVSWDDFVAEARSRPLIVIGGYIHEMSPAFFDEHPGGRAFITRAVGTDASTAFHGGVYDHSNAAHNLLSMMRVGILASGMEVEHLKAGFETSPINPDYTPPAPPEQPNATMLDPTRLHLAPSEKLRITRVVPDARASLSDLSGSLAGATSALSSI